MSTQRASLLAIGYSPTFKRQSAWDVPLAGSELTKAFPATSRNYFDMDETTEDVDDCTGQDLLFEQYLGRFARLNIDFDVDPDVFAGIAAFAYGVAAAPTGGTSEVQTETISATGGNRGLTVMVGANSQTTTQIPFNASNTEIQAALEALSNVASGDIVVGQASNVNEVQTETMGGTGGTRALTVVNPVTGVSAKTAAIAFDANAAAIQAALEALPNVDPGDIVVSGTGPFVYTFSGLNFKNANVALIVIDNTLLTGGSSVMVQTTLGVTGTRNYTFGNAFQKQNVNMIVPNTYALVGGTSTFVETTPGVGLTHAISRLVGVTLPLMTLYVGFRGSSEQPKIFKNVVVDQFRVRSTAREKVTCTVQLIGSGDLEDAVGYTMPDCTDLVPIRFGDCEFTIAGTTFVADELAREFEYYFQNDVRPKFDGPGLDTTRAERADKRPSQYSFFVLGEPGDATYDLVQTRSSLPVSLQLGPAGRYVKCTTPQCLVKPATTPIRFGNDPPESEIAIIGRPRKVSGDVTTPTTISAVIGQTATLLTSA